MNDGEPPSCLRKSAIWVHTNRWGISKNWAALSSWVFSNFSHVALNISFGAFHISVSFFVCVFFAHKPSSHPYIYIHIYLRAQFPRHAWREYISKYRRSLSLCRSSDGPWCCTLFVAIMCLQLEPDAGQRLIGLCFCGTHGKWRNIYIIHSTHNVIACIDRVSRFYKKRMRTDSVAQQRRDDRGDKVILWSSRKFVVKN